MELEDVVFENPPSQDNDLYFRSKFVCFLFKYWSFKLSWQMWKINYITCWIVKVSICMVCGLLIIAFTLCRRTRQECQMLYIARFTTRKIFLENSIRKQVCLEELCSCIAWIKISMSCVRHEFLPRICHIFKINRATKNLFVMLNSRF